MRNFRWNRLSIYVKASIPTNISYLNTQNLFTTDVKKTHGKASYICCIIVLTLLGIDNCIVVYTSLYPYLKTDNLISLYNKWQMLYEES